MDDQMRVSIGAQLDGLLLGMKEATASVRESAEAMKLQFEELNGTVEALSTPFLAISAVLAGGELFEHTIESTVDFAVQLEVLNQKTGISVDELSALKYAADLSHVSFEELSTSLDRFARNVFEAGRGTSTAGDTIKALGLQTMDADGHLRPMSDLLRDVAQRFSTMQDGTGKAAIAMELFGRAGTQMIPFLNQGRDGIAQLESKARELGATMDGEGVQRAIEYEDAMKELEAVVSGLKRDIVEELLPTLMSLAEAFTDGAKSAGTAKGIFSEVGEVLRELSAGAAIATGFLESLWIAVKGTNPTETLASIRAVQAEVQKTVNMLKDPALASDLAKVFGGAGSGGRTGAPSPSGNDRNAEAIADRQIEQARDTALGLLQAERDGVQRRLALKEISAVEADDLDRDIADREYQVKKTALEAELALAKGDVKHQEQIKDQLIQLETQHTHEMSSLTTQLMANIKGQWDGYLAKVKSTFDQVHLVSKNAFANVAFESAKAGIQMLAAHKATELAKAEATGESVAARIGFEIGGAIQSIAIHIGSALKHLAISTAEIVTGTWAWLSNMLGPYAAPVAIGVGAGALALGLSMLPSAAGGFDIPGGTNPLTQLHEREMVLPADLADKIRGMTDGGGGGSPVHIYAMDAQSFVEFAKRNSDAFGHGVAGAIRNNHTALRKALGK